MITGYISRWNKEKWYGFIEHMEGTTFVHITGFKDYINDLECLVGKGVKFETKNTEKGTIAVNVTILKEV